MGPMKVAALNGLTVARGSVLDLVDSENRAPVDDRVSTTYNMTAFKNLFIKLKIPLNFF